MCVTRHLKATTAVLTTSAWMSSSESSSDDTSLFWKRWGHTRGRLPACATASTMAAGPSLASSRRFALDAKSLAALAATALRADIV